MISNLDIYRSAQVLVKQHGQDAPIHAAIQADALLEAGDLDLSGAFVNAVTGNPKPFGLPETACMFATRIFINLRETL